MSQCANCGHDNLLGGPSCSNCGASLTGGGGGGLGVSGPDAEYQKLLRERAAAKSRNQKITMAVLVIAVVGAGYLIMKDRKHKAEIQQTLDFVDAWVELDKRETGAFWNCVTASQTPIDQLSNAQQITGKIEIAFATQPKTYAETVRGECMTKLDNAKSAFRDMMNVPAAFKTALDRYIDSLPNLGTGIEAYVEKLGARQERKDLDSLIQDAGGAWHASTSPTPESIAFDKFLSCAVPGLDKLKDAQALLEFLADECFKRDAAAFMGKAQDSCSKLLETVDRAAKPPGNYKAHMKKFYEDEQRMMTAWSDCARRARKGQKSDDLDAFLVAAKEHMEARGGIGKVGREIIKTQ
ncbi:MAG: hypothetical protein SGI86_21095 [Deltaproteobacteria bacterium]|nr:hypothetical protein [Deltaproteobacteria bacterium]